MNLIPPLPKTISLGRRLKQPERLVACLPHLNWQILTKSLGRKGPDSAHGSIIDMMSRRKRKPVDHEHVHTNVHICSHRECSNVNQGTAPKILLTQHLPLNRNPSPPAAECPFRSHKVKVSFSVIICNKVLQLNVQVNPLPAEARGTCPVMGTRWEGQARHSR